MPASARPRPRSTTRTARSGRVRRECPILCTNPGEVGLIEVTESDDIPAQTGPSGVASIDILDLEEAFVLRYEVNGGAVDGEVEKRFCHTTGSNNGCFRISPLIG